MTCGQAVIILRMGGVSRNRRQFKCLRPPAPSRLPSRSSEREARRLGVKGTLSPTRRKTKQGRQDESAGFPLGGGERSKESTELDDRVIRGVPRGQVCMNVSEYYLADQLHNSRLRYYDIFLAGSY